VTYARDCSAEGRKLQGKNDPRRMSPKTAGLTRPTPARQDTLCHGRDHYGKTEQLKVTIKERFDSAQPYLTSPVEEPRIVHTLLRGLSMPRHNRWPNVRLTSWHLAGLSTRAIAVDGRILNIAAGGATQTSNPHRHIALSNVYEIIPNHESLASRTVHGILLASMVTVGNLPPLYSLCLQPTVASCNRNASCTLYTLACFRWES
jgi:hypothetical protein